MPQVGPGCQECIFTYTNMHFFFLSRDAEFDKGTENTWGPGFPRGPGNPGEPRAPWKQKRHTIKFKMKQFSPRSALKIETCYWESRKFQLRQNHQIIYTSHLCFYNQKLVSKNSKRKNAVYPNTLVVSELTCRPLVWVHWIITDVKRRNEKLKQTQTNTPCPLWILAPLVLLGSRHHPK